MIHVRTKIRKKEKKKKIVNKTVECRRRKKSPAQAKQFLHSGWSTILNINRKASLKLAKRKWYESNWELCCAAPDMRSFCPPISREKIAKKTLALHAVNR